MHLDKKIISILVGCTLLGGIIGGGIGGAISSFSSHNCEGKEGEYRSEQRMMGRGTNDYNNTNYKQMNRPQETTPSQQSNATTSAQ